MAGTLTTEKAKAGGIVEKDKSSLEKILEKMEAEQADREGEFRVIDVELSHEIVGTLRGHFAQNLIYNIPRTSSRGKTSYPECDRMPGGCPYKGKTNHIHILGVGYQGALTALRAYGRMSATVRDMPDMVEQGDKLYWAVYGEALDRHTGNELGRWYLEPVLRKSGNRFIENEFGASIAQSKALRNVILALIPAKLMEGWIEDYKAGKEAFSLKRAKDMGYGPDGSQPPKREPKEKPKNKSNVPTQGARDLAGVMKQLAEDLSGEASVLEEYYKSAGWTKAQAMLRFTNALNDEAELNKLSTDLDTWIEKQKKESNDEEPEMQPAEGELC
jgi:hypothetical protein